MEMLGRLKKRSYAPKHKHQHLLFGRSGLQTQGEEVNLFPLIKSVGVYLQPEQITLVPLCPCHGLLHVEKDNGKGPLFGQSRI